MDPQPAKTTILGAGVAGLATAWKLAKLGRRDIVILEKSETPGGLASSVTLNKSRLDLGSHRIHPEYFPEVLELLRQLIGNNFLRVPRHGRLRLNGRYTNYPPSLGDFLAALGPTEILRCAASLVAEWSRTLCQGPRKDQDTYEAYLLSKVGRRTYDIFYRPYARKVYGIDPRNLSAKAAKTRVTTGNPWTVVRDLALQLFRTRVDTQQYFYYPAGGFGTIPDALLRESTALGVHVITGVTIRELHAASGRVSKIIFDVGSSQRTISTQHVISTIPLHQLSSLIRPTAPAEVTDSAGALNWRGIRILQVGLARERCLEGETYYFPEERYVFGRISEPKQYSPQLAASAGETTLNIEVICSPGDHLWSLDESAFLERVLADVEAINLFERNDLRSYRSVRLPAVYPVYDRWFQTHLDRVLTWVESFDNLYSIGRGGMFFHGSTDHSIHLGLRLAEHLTNPGAGTRRGQAQLADRDFRVRD